MKSLPRAWGRRALSALGVRAFFGVPSAFGLFFAALLTCNAQTPAPPSNLRIVTQRYPSAPTPASLPDTLRLAGTVVDVAGNPVAGALVEVYPAGSSRSTAEAQPKPLQSLTTEANGTYEFRVTRAAVAILARKPGFAPAWSSYFNPVKDVTGERLALTPPLSVAGVVVDEADKPVSDAKVWIGTAYCEKPLDNGRTMMGYSGPVPVFEPVRTGPEGKFRIEGCPSNSVFDLAVSVPGKVLREPKRDYTSPETMRCRAGQQDVKLVVESAGMLEGKVVSQESGQPLANVHLHLDRTRGGVPMKPVTSDAQGKFRFAEVAPDSYRLRPVFGTNQLPDLVAESVQVSIAAGQTTRDVQIAATKGAILEVRVLDKIERKPLPGVMVNAYKESCSFSTGSDSNGVALLRLVPGDYQLSAYRENSRSEGITATVEADKTNHVQIELAPPPTLSGTVRDLAGAPVPNLIVRVLPEYRAANLQDLTTDANGSFKASWNPQRYGGSENTFCIVARDLTRNLALAHDLEEDTATLDLRLEPGWTVAGRVEDVNGRPLTNAQISLGIWMGNIGSQFENQPVKADSQGRFEIPALPADRRYYLTASAKGYGSASQQLQREEAETNRFELAPFALRVADRKLAGQVLDAEDKPVARAWVNMYGEGQPNSSIRTDDQGRFQFDQVCEGSIQLHSSSQRAYGSTRAEGGDTNVILQIGANQSYSVAAAPKRVGLKGKPLPELTGLEFAADCAPAGKPILLCLFDLEQRPSRRLVRLLAEQQDVLLQKGVTVLALQAAVATSEAFKEWQGANPLPFPVGRVAEKTDKTKWATGVESLPWLILTDAQHKVVAEGFGLDELEAKVKAGNP